ncbi:MAG: M1 family metallopeptidase, partial [Gemmatimonadetes bacterium]|nr:M1 family metallopeptidase [Gemmatimonadota bacterium]
MTGTVLFAALAIQAGGAAPPSDWQQGLEYRIEARLDEDAQRLDGRARLRYRNNAPDTLTEFWFHLYLNAFRPNSLWARTDLEAGITTFQELGPEDHGYERITAMEVGGRLVNLVYPFAPDSTIVGFALPEALPPGGSIEIDYAWQARTSSVPRRQGREGRQWDFAQWYPRVVVYDDEGWRLHPLYRAGEFYGEFARYDVTTEVRTDQVIGATGVPVSGDPGWQDAAAPGTGPIAYDREWYGSLEGPPCIERGGERICGEFPAQRLPVEEVLGLLGDEDASDGWKRVRWVADDVHHFAWSTSPDYIYEQGAYEDVSIHVLYRPGDEESWGTGIAVRRTATALQWLDSIFGDYPYPQVTNLHRIEGGGTEFPMLIMDGSASQGLILHEVGHIYAHGILANNEWYEGWLDEGLSSFQTAWFNERAGQGDAVWSGPVEGTVLRDVEGVSEPVVLPAEEYSSQGRYSAAIYRKGSVIFWMLREMAGDAAFTRILRTYYERHRFRHVDSDDFKAVAEEIMGTDLDWFFGGWLHTTGLVDYGLEDVRVGSAPAASGAGAGEWTTTFAVVKKGDLRMPATVEFRGAAGETQRIRVAGSALVGRHEIRTPFEPVAAVLDPDGSMLDWNPADNGWAPGLGDPLRSFGMDDPLLPPARSRSEIPHRLFPLAWGNDVAGITAGVQLRRSIMGVDDLRVQLGLPAVRAGSIGDDSDVFDAGSVFVDWTRRGVGSDAGRATRLRTFAGEGRGFAELRRAHSAGTAGEARSERWWSGTVSWIYEPDYVATPAWTVERKYGRELAAGWVRQSANGMLRWALTGGVGLDTRNHRWARLSLDASVRRPLAEGWE